VTGLALAAGLGAAAGVDLALTLLVLAGLALVGGTPQLPETLAALGTGTVIVPLAAVYMLEIAAERHSLTSLTLWHAAQAFGRPLAGLLLADLALQGAEPRLHLAGMALGAAAASLGHAGAAGWQALLHLRGIPGRGRAVAAAAEDAGVFAYLALAAEHPRVALVLIVLPLVVVPRQVRAATVAFRFLLAALVVAAREHLPGHSRARGRRPRWARRFGARVPAAEGVRESPALLVGGKARTPSIRPGWLAVRGADGYFLPRAPGGTHGPRALGPPGRDGLFTRLSAPPADGTPAELVVPAGGGRERVASLEIMV
jgi:hypothetical protein